MVFFFFKILLNPHTALWETSGSAPVWWPQTLQIAYIRNQCTLGHWTKIELDIHSIPRKSILLCANQFQGNEYTCNFGRYINDLWCPFILWKFIQRTQHPFPKGIKQLFTLGTRINIDLQYISSWLHCFYGIIPLENFSIILRCHLCQHQSFMIFYYIVW